MVGNELLMQFQADVLGVPVIRPRVTETTALGAAYAAGLAVGFWPGLDALRANWQADRAWSPALDPAARERAYHWWQKAVGRTLRLARARSWPAASGRMTDPTRLPRSVDVLIIGGGATGAGLLRDLARRGLRCLLVDKGDLASGTSGRYHGLLHSGARYVARDPAGRPRVHRARTGSCAGSRRPASRTPAACTWPRPDDPDDYVAGFAGRCAAAGVPCDDEPLA